MRSAIFSSCSLVGGLLLTLTSPLKSAAVSCFFTLAAASPLVVVVPLPFVMPGGVFAMMAVSSLLARVGIVLLLVAVVAR